jgi:hypothetical protein
MARESWTIAAFMLTGAQRMRHGSGLPMGHATTGTIAIRGTSQPADYANWGDMPTAPSSRRRHTLENSRALRCAIGPRARSRGADDTTEEQMTIMMDYRIAVQW